MTSGVFVSVELDSITVREDRQRRDLGDLTDLRESIRRNGLIHPIVITREGILVAGERRLSACRQLGLTSISAQYADTLLPDELELIELEENVKRKDLSWQEHNSAISRFHALHKAAAGDAWSIEHTAGALGLNKSAIYKHLAVAKEREAGTKLVTEADKFSTAINVTVRRAERMKTLALKEIIQTEPIEGQPLVSRPIELLHADFHEWAETYSGPTFNFIHCDFPYGKNADKHHQGAAASHGGYIDTPEVYFDLLNTFVSNTEAIVSPSAHMIFWFSMDFYEETKEFLHAGGWKILAHPLIWWKMDNTGIMPDPQRQPRRVYETALFCTRGDRLLVQPVSNLVAAQTTKQFHMSEKPSAVLDHFFRMFVDEYTRLLDPTCGSGMAIKVAEVRGAAYALGLEKDKEFFDGACVNLDL